MQKNKTTHIVAGILILFFVAIFLVLTGRFLYIQATGEVNGISLDDWAAKKRTSSYSLHANRGKILDDNGMTLAYDMPTFEMYAIVDESYSKDSEDPIHVDDPGKTASALAPILDVDESYIKERIEKGIDNDQFQVEFGKVGKDLDQKTKEEIEELDLPGIQFDKQYMRKYPNAMFASHIIGYAKRDDGNITGVTGIENEMNDYLGGENGHISYRHDRYGTKLLDPKEVVTEPKDGDDVYLTIDQKIQTLLEDTLSQVDEEYNPERMTAVVVNPKTGEVVAMGSRPSYNPNSPTDVENWYNDVVSTPFDPGSTMKIFTWASAIDAGVYNGSEEFKSGKYKAEDYIETIHDHNAGEGWGSISYDEGFARSSNVAAARLVWDKLGTDDYLDYLKAFDFDEVTGIDLPDEVPGGILYNRGIEQITTSFGQGTTMTPIQQIKAATAIANDGKMMKPYVISSIKDSDSDKVLKEKEPEVVGEPIKKETASKMRDLMETVVNGENGTGKGFKLDEYTVAGKTGTSQIPGDSGTFLTGKENHIFSFLGMAPKDDPELLMYVSVKQPELDDTEAGSVPVSFIFKNVMENGLQYLNIEPDKDSNENIETVNVDNIIGADTEKTAKSLKEKGLQVSVVGSGKTIDATNVEEDSDLFPGDRVILLTEKPEMPNIKGWSQRDVLQLTDLLGIDVDISGSGYVKKQSIEKGDVIKEDDILEVELEAPGENNEGDDEDS